MTESHNLSNESFTNSCPFAWSSCYYKKAKCVRILCPEYEVIRSSDIPNITRIKFITNEKDSHLNDGYSWSALVKHLSSEDEFYDSLNCYLNGFDRSEINIDYWKDICNVLELANFKYRENSETKNGWLADLQTSEQEFKDKARALSLVQQKVIGKFGAALQTDMENSEAKCWMSALVDTLLDSCNMRDELHCDSSPLCGSIATQVELTRGDIEDPTTSGHFSAPCSSNPVGSFEHSPCHVNLESLSIESLSDTSAAGTKENLIPDLLVMSRDYPGFFPLVVEIRPADSMYKGCFPIVKQMLSKLFFQDVIFGIIISPLCYRVIIIYKRNGTLHFESTNDIKFTTKKMLITNDSMDTEIRLDLEKLTDMCTLIYRILKWALKTNCGL